ncbi:MAG: protein translocase SEC61 complex subunit gamma [Candidatus Aenigmatarchaeota archaeon]
MSISSFFKSCKRVLKVATKPSREEFFQTAKVTAIGIGLIGAIGFAVFLIFQLPSTLGM